jgi:hypothetical protein
MEISSIGNFSNVGNIPAMATEMRMANVQTEAAVSVLNMAEETLTQEGESLIRMMNASFTGLGQNFDMSV